ncbi:nuclease-related domain-containing protein [Phocicoccus pinnipedialis]|uniref:Nuclease-related domain protein n=1 Tax=Phocicoccus pinnipedialis TaxID=110845 RepID=A0A6V7R705_9BACL|nr:nuclease-related domain-containing protein [Jeotgalicoccus pinnipedialis]MBP1938940.1 hypothetical protein [Jeotgalicoccus pinnipedialis]CAD2073220.1 Nuclease-related domain protein [Jeotgalicoccus pinnipedialis]
MNKLEILKKRMPLNATESRLLLVRNLGIEGEAFISRILSEKLNVQPLVLEDFLFEIDGSECQIDFLLIFEYECLIIEVKHYDGDYIYGDEFITKLNTKKSYPNPTLQLVRATDRLAKLFVKENIRMKIITSLLYTHPGFYLYHAPVDSRVVFLPQIKKFMETLNKKPCGIQERHERVFERLKSLRLESSSYERKITYDFDELKKCVTCAKCDGEMVRKNAGDRKYVYCTLCDTQENFQEAMLRNSAELEYLFPEKRLTLSLVLEWVGDCISRQFLRNILATRYKLVRSGRTTHYVRRNLDRKL